MASEVMTLDEITEDIQKSDYKRAALFDVHGNQLIPWNSKSIPVTRRLTEIKRRLASKATADGVYQVHAKHWGQKAVADIYYVIKGDPDRELADIEISKPREIQIVNTDPESSRGGFVSMETHNELYREKVDLEYKVRELERLLEQANATIYEFESEDEGKGGLLSDDTQTFLERSLETVTPLIEKLMEQRDVNQQIELLKIQMQMNGNVPATLPNNPAPQEQMADGEEDEFLTEEEEAYLAGMNNLRENHPEIYNEAIKRMQEGGDHE